MITTRIGTFFQKAIIQEKLNNWLGLFFVIIIAGTFGYVMSEDMIAGLIVFVVFVGIGYFIICVSSSMLTLYILMCFAFFVEFFLRLFLGGKFLTGVLWDALIGLAFVGMFLGRNEIKQNFRELSRSPIAIIYFFFLLYTPIQILNPNSESLEENLLALRKFIGYLVILYFLYSTLDSYDKIRKYIVFLFITSGLCAFYGCFQQWHGLFKFELDLIMADPFAFGLTFVNGDFRKYSTLSDSSIFGILMSVCAVFFIIIAINIKKTSTKLILSVGCILMILGMAYSATRTAYAALIAGVLFYCLLTIEKKKTQLFGFIAVSFLAFLIWAPFYGGRTLYRFRTTFEAKNDESYKVRATAWNFIQPYIQRHPIGGGLGTSGNAGYREHPGHPLAGFQPDSSYVKKAAETGWVGLALTVAFYYVTLAVGIRNFFSVHDEEIKAIYAACICSLFTFYVAEFAQQAIGGITDSVIYYPILVIILKLKKFDSGIESKL